MRTPTLEQQVILENKARIRVVRAVPGSGKTWLVAEVMRQTLDTWPTKMNGIAALSFTRVGGDEIRKAVGQELGHPHYVGTIDAFLFRYVIRPYLRRVFPWFAEPRLLVGDWGGEHWGNYGFKQSAVVGQGINLFGCVCIGEESGEALMGYKPHQAQSLQLLYGDELREVKAGKKEIWKKRGLLTHSDAALWASKILEHPTSGEVIRAEITRRFPFLIVDELQDTGYFLGKSIRLLLGAPTIGGLLVGDPDQAIYEFTGARPDLFNTFEAIADATSLPLSSSLRCSAATVNAAIHVKDSGGEITSAKGRVGRAFLVRYNDMVGDVSKVVEAARINRATAPLIKVVARGATTIEDLARRRIANCPSLYCPPLTHMHRAVVAFRRGKNVTALAATRAALERAIFHHEGVSDEELIALNIDPSSWKELAVRCLLKINAMGATGTIFDWHATAGKVLDQEIQCFELGQNLNFTMGKLKPQQRNGWDKPSADFLPQFDVTNKAITEIPVQTIHGVKGETHDVTIFVCPPTKTARCPSTVWWSSNDKDREEKRIAYVAMTRTQGDLIVCVSNACYQRLTDSRAEFTAAFVCMTVDECVTSLPCQTAVIGDAYLIAGMAMQCLAE